MNKNSTVVALAVLIALLAAGFWYYYEQAAAPSTVSVMGNVASKNISGLELMLRDGSIESVVVSPTTAIVSLPAQAPAHPDTEAPKQKTFDEIAPGTLVGVYGTQSAGGPIMASQIQILLLPGAAQATSTPLTP